MEPIEIIVIILASLIVLSVLVCSIIRRKKGKTSCGCDCSSCGAKCHCNEKTKNDSNQ